MRRSQGYPTLFFLVCWLPQCAIEYWLRNCSGYVVGLEVKLFLGWGTETQCNIQHSLY